MGTRSFPGVK